MIGDGPATCKLGMGDGTVRPPAARMAGMKTQSPLIVFAFLLGCAMLIFGWLGYLGIVQSPLVAAAGIACVVGLGLTFEMRRRRR